jgi:hypothetical protein
MPFCRVFVTARGYANRLQALGEGAAGGSPHLDSLISKYLLERARKASCFAPERVYSGAWTVADQPYSSLADAFDRLASDLLLWFVSASFVVRHGQGRRGGLHV